MVFVKTADATTNFRYRWKKGVLISYESKDKGGRYEQREVLSIY